MVQRPRTRVRAIEQGSPMLLAGLALAALALLIIAVVIVPH